jgi:hypothetical protein
VSEIIVNSDTTLSEAIGELREAFRVHKWVRMVLRVGLRSLDQNAVIHCWYEQMGRELREDSAQGWRRYCKLHHGVPILRAEDTDFRAFYDTALKSTLTYEEKLRAMDFVPVTRLMSVAQLSAYMEALQDDFRTRGVTLIVEEKKRKARKAA